MVPTREGAHKLLDEGLSLNPGLWGKHVTLVAECAERIARRASLDPEKAYILGLLHDIGRRFGVTTFAHVIDGYEFLSALGYDEAERVCLTHSFSTHRFEDFCGKIDVSDERVEKARALLSSITYDDYDRLIQLCDCLAGTEITDMETRHGKYTKLKWDTNLWLKTYFDRLTCGDVYEIIGLTERSHLIDSHIRDVVNEWDPLGLFPGASQDEYSTEIEAIKGLIQHGITEERLAEELDYLFRLSFGDTFPCSEVECRRIASRLLQ